ncbi:hypothetical protein Tco_0205666 [Tanacetum coccineum]
MQFRKSRRNFTPYWKFPIFDDDDDEYTIQYKEYLENSSKAIIPDLPTEEPDNSLSMGDERLDTIPKTESDEVIKSSVEDLVPILSESEGIFDNMCDVPFCDKNHFNVESDLIESLLNRDTLIVYSTKIDSFLEEFAGKLVHIDLISPEINEANFDPEKDLDALKDHFEIFFDDCTSSDDDYGEDIYYVEASTPDSELVSLEEVEDFDPKDGETDTDILKIFNSRDHELNLDFQFTPRRDTTREEPCYNQNFDETFPQNSPNFLQILCCENCGGPHEIFQSQPMNQNFYNSNSSGFDQFQPPQYPVSFPPPEESIKEFFEKHAQEMITTVQSAVKIVIQQHEQAVQKEQEEQASFTPYWKFLIFDDDDEYTIKYREYL